jgi:hypothetical protein
LPYDPRLEEHVAKALYSHHVGEAVRSVDERKTIPLELIRSTAERLTQESDRSCAIIMYNLIDDLTQELILQECNPEISGLKNRLFGQFGMLPNSANRFLFLFALGWISRDVFHNMNIIRKIRNEFAHNILCDSFSCDVIRSYATSIAPTHVSQLERVLDTAHAYDPTKLTRDQVDLILRSYHDRKRLFFVLEASFLMNELIGQICVMPEARRQRVHLTHVLVRSKLISELNKETVCLVLDILYEGFGVHFPPKDDDPSDASL